MIGRHSTERTGAVDLARDAVLGRRILRGSLGNYGARAVSLITWFLLTPFLLHSLGDADYGLWVLVGWVVAYGWLFDLGIGRTTTKYVAEYAARHDPAEVQRVISTSVWLYSLLGGLVFVCAVGLSFAFPHLFAMPAAQQETARWLVLLMGAEVALALPCSVGTAVLQGLHRYDVTGLIEAVGTLAYAACIVVIVSAGGGVVGMVAANIPLTVATQLVSARVVRSLQPDLRFRWSGARLAMAPRIFRHSSWLFLLQLSGMLRSKTDEIVVGGVISIGSVASYSVARRLADLSRDLSMQFVGVLMPAASELDAMQEGNRLRALYLAATRLSLAIFVPLFGAIVFLAGPFLALWVGPQYASGAPIVLILLAANLVWMSQAPATSVLSGMARHRPMALVAIGSGLANLGISIVLARSQGLVGVALGTLIASSVECLAFRVPYSMRVLQIGLREAARGVLMPVAVPAVPMVLALAIVQRIVEPTSLLSLAVIGAAGVLVYAAAYLVVGTGSVEREVYRAFLTRARRRMRLGGAASP